VPIHLALESPDISDSSWPRACRLARSFAEKVAGDVDYCKASPFFGVRLEIRFDEDFDGLVAGINFNAHRRIAEITSCRRPFFLE
jgi:hypothetical protein